MENVIVAIIVGMAVAYLAKPILGIFRAKQQDTCGCGCAGCDQMAACNAEMRTIQRKHD
jgi:hypothetical protein